MRRTTDNKYKLQLDPALIRARRLSLGMSERQLAAALGHAFSEAIVRGLESGRTGSELLLTDICRLAETLDVAAVELMAIGTNPEDDSVFGPPTRRQFERARTALVRELGALLNESPGPVPVEAMARVLEVTLTELDDLVTTLGEVLTRAGLEVRTHAGALSVGPRHGAPDVERLQAAGRASFGRTGLNSAQASALRSVIEDTYSKKNQSKTNADALSSLIKAGLIERSDADNHRRLSVTEDVRFSLLLD